MSSAPRQSPAGPLVGSSSTSTAGCQAGPRPGPALLHAEGIAFKAEFAPLSKFQHRGTPGVGAPRRRPPAGSAGPTGRVEIRVSISTPIWRLLSLLNPAQTSEAAPTPRITSVPRVVVLPLPLSQQAVDDAFGDAKRKIIHGLDGAKFLDKRSISKTAAKGIEKL